MTKYSGLREQLEAVKEGFTSLSSSAKVINAFRGIVQARKLAGTGGKDFFAELMTELSTTLGSDHTVGIAIEALSAAFEAEVRGKMRFNDELQWLLESQSKVVDEYRRLILGIDKDELAEFILEMRRTIRLSGVRHYQGLLKSEYIDDIVVPFVDLLRKSPKRLQSLMSHPTTKAAAKMLKNSGQIALEDLWKIKGEVMEMLAAEMKRRTLAKIQKEHPNAVLIEDVMAKTSLTRDGEEVLSAAPRQIWDGIIAEITDTGLIIHAKFEVKSGLNGFKLGFDQILATLYSRFTTRGDELLITTKDGAEYVFKRGAAEGSAESIRGLDTINTLITPTGVSWMMPNQRVVEGDFELDFLLMEIGKHEVSHIDIEVLVMDLLRLDLLDLLD